MKFERVARRVLKTSEGRSNNIIKLDKKMKINTRTVYIKELKYYQMLFNFLNV